MLLSDTLAAAAVASVAFVVVALLYLRRSKNKEPAGTAEPAPVAAPPTRQPRPVRIKVLTWNVLGDGPRFALSQKHTQYCLEQQLQWNIRGPKIVKFIRQFNPDVCCLQETQDPTYCSTFAPQFKPDFATFQSVAAHSGLAAAFDLTKTTLIRYILIAPSCTNPFDTSTIGGS